MPAKFTLGLYKPDDKIFNIQDVEHEQRLHFVCLLCGDPLTCVLKKGKISLHFKHRNQDERCHPVLETLLHKAAKRLIFSNRQILLPDHRKSFTYLDAQEEKVWDKYRPDLTLITEDKPIYVEIVVSNPISSDKNLAYFQHRVDCLVIDLSQYPKLFAMMDLEEDVLNNLENRLFLHQYLKPTYKKTITDNTEDTIVKILIGGIIVFGLRYVLRNNFFGRKRGR